MYRVHEERQARAPEFNTVSRRVSSSIHSSRIGLPQHRGVSIVGEDVWLEAVCLVSELVRPLIQQELSNPERPLKQPSAVRES